MIEAQQKYDVLAIGDVVSDIFLPLKGAKHISLQESKDGELIVFDDGEKIPIDKPIYVHGVGNSSNAAVASSRLGFNAGLVSAVGDDYLGQEILKHLLSEEVSVEFIEIDENYSSNLHFVLWYQPERVILLNHQKFHYHFPSLKENLIPEWIYLSSIAPNIKTIYPEIKDFLIKNSNVKLLFQPGSYQIPLIDNDLKEIVKLSEVLILNKEEAAIISKKDPKDIHYSANILLNIGVKLVIITDGPIGSYAMSDKNRKLYFLPAYPDPSKPKERTGAGDSYASAFMGSLIHGNDFKTAMAWGSINAMSVVQYVGAQEGLLSSGQIQQYLNKAPESFVVREVS